MSADGHDVVVLSRRPGEARGWRAAGWDGETVEAWAGEVDGADAVINLAGRSVNCRYTPAHRREIHESRVRSAAAVGQAIARAARPPRVWLQMSTATIYATRWMLEIAAIAMRTETELVLKSRRVIPGRLLAGGFAFRFPEWAAAAHDLRAAPPSAHGG